MLPGRGQQDCLQSLSLTDIVRRLEPFFQHGFLGRDNGQFEFGACHAFGIS